MPQIKVNEIDQSRYTSVSQKAPIIVACPIIASFGDTENTKILQSESDVTKYYGKALEHSINKDFTRNYVLNLINNGVTVLAKRIKPAGADTLIAKAQIDSSTDDSKGTITVQAKWFGSYGNNICVGLKHTSFNTGILNNSGDERYTITVYELTPKAYSDDDMGKTSVGDLGQGLKVATNGVTYTIKTLEEITLNLNPTSSNYIKNINSLCSNLSYVTITFSKDNNTLTNVSDIKALLEAFTNEDSFFSNNYLVLDNGADFVANNDDTLATTDISIVDADDSSDLDGMSIQLSISDNFDNAETVSLPTTLKLNPATLYYVKVTNVGEHSDYSISTLPVTFTTVAAGKTNDVTIKFAKSSGSTNSTTIEVGEGTDTKIPNIIDSFINVLSESDSASVVNPFWDTFLDPYTADFDFVCGGGLIDSVLENIVDKSVLDPMNSDSLLSQDTIYKQLLNVAYRRGDVVALIDTPKDWNADDVYNFTYKIGSSDSAYSYGTVHAPWCKMRDIVTGSVTSMMPSLVFLTTVSNNLNKNAEAQLWYTPAGVARAQATKVLGAEYEIGQTILDKWQNDNVARVNPIMKILSYGYTIYGNATLMQDVTGYSKSSLQSLGTRVLCNVVKKAIFSICVALTFEPNDYHLYAQFKTKLDEILSQIKLNGGLSDYQIVMDESTVTDIDKQNLRVPGKVVIAPTRPAEFFDIDFTITGAGVTFNNETNEEEEGV